MNRLYKNPAFLIALFLTAIFFMPLFFDLSFCYRDIHRYFLPYKHLYAESLRQGILPLWNPYMFCGMPFLASLQTHVFYLPNLLMLLPWYPKNFTLFIVFHYAVTAWLTYRLAKRLGQTSEAACLAAVAWTGSGYLLSILDMVSTLCAIAWLPWVLHAAWDLFEKMEGAWREWRRPFLELMIGLLFMILGGEPTVAYSTGMVLMGLATWWGPLAGLAASLNSGFVCNGSLVRLGAPGAPEAPFRWTSRLKGIASRWGMITLAYVAACALGAAQILPFLEYISTSARGSGFTYLQASAWSFHFLHLLTFVFPFLMGDQMLTEATWYDISQLWVKSPYMSLVALFLAWLGWRGKQHRIWGWIAVAGLLLAIGKYTPAYQVLFNYLPGLNYIRYPIKFLSLFTFGLAMLAGFGFDRLRQEGPVVLKGWTGRWLAVGGISCLAFGVWITLVPTGMAWIVKDRIGSFRSQVSDHFAARPLQDYEKFLAPSATRGVIFLILLIAIVWMWKKEKLRSSLTAVFLALLLALDLVDHSVTLNPVITSEVFRTPWKTLRDVKNGLAPGRRLYAMRPDAFAFGKTNLQRVIYVQAAMDANEPIVYGIPYATGYESMPPSRFQCLLGINDEFPSDQRARILTIMNVGYVASMKPMKSKWLKQEQKEVVWLYRYTGPAVGARILRKVTVVNTPEEAKRVVDRPNFDPVKEAVVERVKYERVPPPEMEDRIAKTSKDNIQEISRSAHQLSYRVSLDTRGWFITSESYDPGWQVYVDGIKSTVFPADVIIRGVPLPQGHHEVTFQYEPGSFYAGLWISGVTLFGLIAIFLL